MLKVGAKVVVKKPISNVDMDFSGVVLEARRRNSFLPFDTEFICNVEYRVRLDRGYEFQGYSTITIPGNQVFQVIEIF